MYAKSTITELAALLAVLALLWLMLSPAHSPGASAGMNARYTIPAQTLAVSLAALDRSLPRAVDALAPSAEASLAISVWPAAVFWAGPAGPGFGAACGPIVTGGGSEVDGRHPVAPPDEGVDQVSADEAGSARDENFPQSAHETGSLRDCGPNDRPDSPSQKEAGSDP